MVGIFLERPVDEKQPHRAYPLGALLLGVLVLVLLVDGLIRGRGDFDYRLIDAVQRLDTPGLESIMRAINTLTGPYWSIAVWLAVLLVLSLIIRSWLPALTVAVIPAGWLVSELLSWLANWQAPDPNRLERVIAEPGSTTFPSVHTVWTVLIYGTVFFLAGRISNPVLRLSVRAATLVLLALAGFAQIWLGASWVLDVLAAYALGFALLLMLYWAYLRIDAAVGDIPFVHAAEIHHDEDQPHAHALTSTILFRDGKAIKIYAPGFVPRAVYWLAFQAEFPYMRNEAALKAAVLRRNLAGRLTEYWYGENRVARALGIERFGNRYGLVSEYIEEVEDGRAPEQVEEFLLGLCDRFDDAGLPTWQIDPRQPRGTDNVLEARDHKFHIIDLESGLVSPMASPRAWWRAIRCADFPLFDTVFFDTTREYIAEHSQIIREKMGDAWFDETCALIDRAEAATAEWHATEPRIWSRMLAAFWGGFGLRTLYQRARDAMDRGHERAEEWVVEATTTWREEGRISAAQEEALRKEIATPRFHRVLPHFGVHLTIGIVTRFPVGSILRTSYTLLNLLAATFRLLLRRIGCNEWREQASVHSPLVIVLAGMPGFGIFSYLASKPIRSNHLLMRLVLDTVLVKIPFRLYERFGWRALVARQGNVEREALESLPEHVNIAGLRVNPGRVTVGVIVVGAVVMLAGVLIQLVEATVEPAAAWWTDATHIFDADVGDGLANWYQAGLVVTTALVLLIIALTKHHGETPLLPLAGLALIVLAPLYDEHMPEQFELVSVFQRAITGEFDDPADWLSVVIASGITLLLVSVAIWFLRAVPEHIRGLFLVGVTAYLGGAIGVEVLAIIYDAIVSEAEFIHEMLIIVEEAIEIIGVAMFLYAVLEYARWSQHAQGTAEMPRSS